MTFVPKSYEIEHNLPLKSVDEVSLPLKLEKLDSVVYYLGRELELTLA